MNDKDRRYWEGIAKANTEEKHQPAKSMSDVLHFLDDAYRFIKDAKGEVALSEPTEIEFYKKWVALSKK